MTSPRIDASVIVPVYNCEAWLKPLLASVLDQEGVALEVIAVCDGATDGSLAVLEAMAARDARIRVVTQENRGLSATRNVGLALARGEWIVFADGDDWMKPGALRAWIGHGREHDLEVVIGNGFSFETLPAPADPAPLYERQPWGEICNGKTWMARTVPNDDWVVCAWLQCVRRDFVERHGLRFEEGIVHEDIIWALQVALKAQRVGFVRELYYGYRRNPASITNSPSPADVARRAAGYLRVIDALVTAALDPRAEAGFRRLLLRQANREGGNLLHILRKRMSDDQQRKLFAQQFLQSGYIRVMLKGATNASEFWRAVRCWRMYSRFAA
ncbi:glycosyltransferase, group 2 family protein [Caballeronia hypogeia]|uniref:Glycosyltransferase, group 2 family protein n=1 Tax=Caballeronia hypogeia TaxID=1777140 RepID=A0A158C2V7_9BURK|nr:glycosyltransferase [Caballeronia hypogeia]SAK76580.1 glycosyltransferase, group 2 family protein [Caballeronia hypogeia]